MKKNIFITGGTGYMGSRLIPLLAERGHRVTALIRKGSEDKLPAGATKALGDPLRRDSYTKFVRGADTFIHLIGAPHPSPAKSRQFREIDYVSVQVAAKAACEAEVKHFIYLSVAQPAPIMREYVAVRAECETVLHASGLPVTFLRPWYVLGPGHRWPYMVLPLYWVAACLPGMRNGSRRLGLVTLSQMLKTLLWTVENPPEDVQILEVPQIRKTPKLPPST